MDNYTSLMTFAILAQVVIILIPCVMMSLDELIVVFFSYLMGMSCAVFIYWAIHEEAESWVGKSSEEDER